MRNKAKNKYYTVGTVQESNTQTHNCTLISIKSGGAKLDLRPKPPLSVFSTFGFDYKNIFVIIANSMIFQLKNYVELKIHLQCTCVCGN